MGYDHAVFNFMLNRELVASSEPVAWTDYRKATFDHLQSKQNKDGSWPAPLDSQGGISVGPVYSAAVWCTILQLDKKTHPLTRTRALVTF